MQDNIENVVIIGSGPAGYSAAIYAARAGLKPLLISGPQPGGQLVTTTIIENYPGFEDGIDAFSLITAWQKQAEKFGTRIIHKTVTFIDHEEKIKTIYLDDGDIIETFTVIVATGASAKWLKIQGEEEYKNKGISACATCDGFAFKNKVVAVIGGGDTAFEEALYLSNLCEKVYLIHRRWEFRASKIMVDRARANNKIEFVTNTIPDKFVGDGNKLTSIICKNVDNNEPFTINVDGAFVAIGHVPNTSFLRHTIVKADGYVVRSSSRSDQRMLQYVTKENDPTGLDVVMVDGMYVAGDCADNEYRQAITAAADGCKAALEVERYLSTLL